MTQTSPGRRVAGNTGYMGIAGLLGKVLHFGLMIYLGNTLTRAGFGVLGFALTAAIVFAVLADFGLEQYATLVIARNKPRLSTWMRRFIGHRILVAGASAVVMVLFLVGFALAGRVPPVVFASVGYMLAMSLLGVVRVFFRGVERMEFEALLAFLEKALMVALALLHLTLLPWPSSAAPENAAVLNVLAAFIEADLIVLLLGLALAARLARSLGESDVGAPPPEAADFGAFLREVWPYALGALCVTIFYREDTLMLQAMKGEEVVGDYRYAFLLFETLFLFPQTVALAAYPAISAMTGSGQSTRAFLGGMARLFALISIPAAAGGVLVGGDLVTLVFPRGENAQDVWALLIWALPFVYANFLYGTALTASGHQKKNLAASAAMAASNLILNLLLIPRWGAPGAALATAVTQGLYAVLLGGACRGVGIEVALSGTLVRTTAAAAVMALALRFFGGGVAVFVAIPAGAAVFFIAALLFGAVSPSEIRSLIERRRPAGSV